ncbi:MAG TPA: hypothetical protein DDW19_01835 [Anaerolineaceae bacterium]|jgi:hypothetical protein|nr:hypothetical protein [Anaerolineaceae bacterium]
MAIEESVWMLEHEQRLMAWAVWHIAALGRARKMPALQALMKQPGAKALSPEEAEERRKEFDQMRHKWQATQPH